MYLSKRERERGKYIHKIYINKDNLIQNNKILKILNNFYTIKHEKM